MRDMLSQAMLCVGNGGGVVEEGREKLRKRLRREGPLDESAEKREEWPDMGRRVTGMSLVL